MEKIYKSSGKLVIEVPLKQKDSSGNKIDNIVGLIDGENIGFSYLIDMSYKDKNPQVSDFFFMFSGIESDFIKICKRNKIQICRL